MLSWPSPIRHVTWADRRTGALSALCFFRNRSHETRPAQTAQIEPRISQMGSNVEQNSSDTVERNLTWREWVQYWQDNPSTSRSRKLSLRFHASECFFILYTAFFFLHIQRTPL
jgi:hypothetical protein